MRRWTAADLACAAKTAGLVIEISLDDPDSVSGPIGDSLSDVPPGTDHNFIPIEEIGDVKPLDQEVQDVEEEFEEAAEESEAEECHEIEDEYEEPDDEVKSAQSFELGMRWSLKEAGITNPLKVQTFLEAAKLVATGRAKTAEALNRCLIPCAQSVFYKQAEDKDLIDREIGGMPSALRLAMLAGGGAAAGGATGAGLSALKKALLGTPDDGGQRLRRAALLGALTGGGLGTYRYLSDEGQVPAIEVPEIIRKGFNT